MLPRNLKLYVFFLMTIVFIGLCVPHTLAATVPQIDASAYVLMSADTGEILAENNGKEKLFPASTTKLMTMVIVMEALENGKVGLEDTVTTSEYASSMGGSQVYLEAGETRTLKEMLIGIAVGSGNDACVAVAEFLSGTEAAFVEEMNNKANELGMKNTNFVNPHGLHDENHYTSAEDLALLAYYALCNYPEILEYTGIYEYEFRQEPKQLILWNTNKLLKWYEGADGLKTGYTSNAGRNLVSTAVRNDMRLISVVMGVEPKNGHFKESMKLLDFGFNNYIYQKKYDKNQVICSVPVKKGIFEYVDLMTVEKSGFISEKSKQCETTEDIKIISDVKAPIEAGDILGQVEIIKDGKIVSSTDLIAITDVEIIPIHKQVIKTFKNIILMG